MKTLSILLICIWLCGCAPLFAGSDGTRRHQELSGFASWYSSASCRREGTSGIMANGQPLDDRAKTCALWMLSPSGRSAKPKGTSYRVTSIRTGRSVVVAHTDNGPGRKARARGVVIDLTPAAFRALGGNLAEGRIKVKVERYGKAASCRHNPNKSKGKP